MGDRPLISMNLQERRQFRKFLEADSFRIANEIEYEVLRFIVSEEGSRYPSQHLNDILNHLEEESRLLIPGYEAIDINRGIVHSLYSRGLLGCCSDVHFDNLPNGITGGYRIPDPSVAALIGSYRRR